MLIFTVEQGPEAGRPRARRGHARRQAGPWRRRAGLSESRLMARLHAHAALGAIEGGGVCRLALADADRLRRDPLMRWMRWMRELGLEVRLDASGNSFGIRVGGTRAAPAMTR